MEKTNHKKKKSGRGMRRAACLMAEIVLILGGNFVEGMGREYSLGVCPTARYGFFGGTGKEAEWEEFFDSAGDRFPQTVVSRVVRDFLQSPLPEGKEKKKVIVMGYDGFREDGLETILEDPGSAVRMVAEEGGLYRTYAGGEQEREQETTTGPGWASILTGDWCDVTGVKTCAHEKKESAKTFLTEAAEMGYKAAFVASWDGHFSVTYRGDMAYAKRQQLPLRYIQAKGDQETYETVLQLVKRRQGEEKQEGQDPDVIFFTLEGADGAGHETGYGNENPQYRDACVIADTCGRNIIWEIRQRDTYEREDWLILITTDHGGTGNSHGGQTEEERNTWMASSREVNLEDYGVPSPALRNGK